RAQGGDGALRPAGAPAPDRAGGDRRTVAALALGGVLVPVAGGRPGGPVAPRPAFNDRGRGHARRSIRPPVRTTARAGGRRGRAGTPSSRPERRSRWDPARGSPRRAPRPPAGPRPRATRS